MEAEVVEEEEGEEKKSVKNKKRQQKVSKTLCTGAVSSLTVACLDRSACLAFYARPKQLWINTDVCNSTGWCRASRQPRMERRRRKPEKMKQKKKFVHLLPLLLKIHCPHLPLGCLSQGGVSMWFFLEFQRALFSLDLLSAEFSPLTMSSNCQGLINLLILHKLKCSAWFWEAVRVSRSPTWQNVFVFCCIYSKLHFFLSIKTWSTLSSLEDRNVDTQHTNDLSFLSLPQQSNRFYLMHFWHLLSVTLQSVAWYKTEQ